MEKEEYIDVKNYIRAKKGLYYAVMAYTNVRGERKEKWFPTKLSVKNNKTRAETISRHILREFEVPIEDRCIHDVKQVRTIDYSRPIEEQLLENLLTRITLSELSHEQVSSLLFADYMKMYLPITKKRRKQIAETTYDSYRENVKSAIEPYFRKQKIRLKDLTGKDIQDFYDVQLNRVTANTVIHYHAIMRLALCYARKMGYIKSNPIEEVDKPERNKFIGSYYSIDEVNKLIEISKGTKLELPILFACFYGLRRSECVGLRWSAFDFENNCFKVNHAIVSAKINGKKQLIPKDNLKTVASVRILPLDHGVKERLLEIKQDRKKGNNKMWQDYIMVDNIGTIIKPGDIPDFV